MTDELAILRTKHERLELLYQVANIIHSTLEPQEALQLIVEAAVRLMSASSGSAVLINPTTGFLEIHASQGLPPGATELKLRVGEGRVDVSDQFTQCRVGIGAQLGYRHSIRCRHATAHQSHIERRVSG